MTDIKDKPILFTAEMVRAILDGRKTQTRRVVKPQPDEDGLSKLSENGYGGTAKAGMYLDTSGNEFNPKYKVGEILWVREGCRCNGWSTDLATIFYKANERDSYTEMTRMIPIENHKKLPVDGKWRSPLFMPKWASRIWLEVTDVRVEKVQDISEDAAKSEGVEFHNGYWMGELHPVKGTHKCRPFAKYVFKDLWNSINEKKGFGWEKNPWVWVYTFKVLSITGRKNKQ